jgi:hypothetical protein
MKGTQGFGKTPIKAAILITAALSLAITGCSSSGEGDYDSAWVGDIEKDINVSGSVGDGPAVNATVTIRKKNGEELASFKSDASASYDVSLAVSERHFPLLVDATGGTDLVTNAAPDFVLRSAVLSARDTVTANVNPFSTIAYELAKDLNGGVTSQNLLAAEDIVAKSMNCGLTTLVSAGPLQTPVDGTNVSEIVKASEVLAEIVRRTRDALNGGGHDVTADDVIESLGADLIDGVIEGNGGARADARTAAVANVATAEVLLEAMSNQLHVNGVDATEAMRSAIQQVVPTVSGPSIDELGATAEMIYQATIGLEAAYEITGDARTAELMQALAAVQPGMEPALVEPLLPSDYRGALGSAVSTTARADMTVVNSVNQLARSGGSQGVAENRPPAISGQPAANVQVGDRYDFSPVASDLDNDALTFSIAAQPDWASFDSATGRLSGTPQADDAGTYDGVTITVSDGELSSSIGPFAITVKTNNNSPSISGTPPRVVAVGERYAFRPGVSDPDSTVFRFEIAGKPSWASFDVLTGSLTGTPAAGDEGIYTSIEISVTDGIDTVTLPAFSIEVVAAGTATGSVTLNWTPPTQNEDGSQLTNLAAYRILWSRDGSSFRNSVRVNNPSVTRYVVENLTPGTYEFSATAINSAGVESRFSNSITKVVQ